MADEYTPFSGAARTADYVEDIPPPPAAVPVVAPAEVPPAEAGEEEPGTGTAASPPALTVVPEAVPTTAPEVAGTIGTEPAVPAGPDPQRLVHAATTTAPAAVAGGLGRARTGWRGTLARAGFPVAPGKREQAARQEERVRAAALADAERVIRQATWTRAVAALVANPKGGTGKTPLALVLGGLLAAVRGGGVVVCEVADDPGALGFRAEGAPALGLGEFVRDVHDLITRGRVVGYTAPQTSFASVIGTVVGADRPPLTYDAVTQVAGKLDEYFEIRVMDSGNQPSSGPFQAAVETADVLVVPVMCAGDSTLEALGMLRQLRTTDAGTRLADAVIAVVMDDGRPQTPHMAEAVRRELAAAGVRTFHHLPYDAHLAARGEITLADLSQATTRALTLLAADVTRALTWTATQHQPTTTNVTASETKGPVR